MGFLQQSIPAGISEHNPKLAVYFNHYKIAYLKQTAGGWTIYELT